MGFMRDPSRGQQNSELSKILKDVPLILTDKENAIDAFKTQVTKYLESHELPPKDKYPTILAQVVDEILLRAKDNDIKVDRSELREAYFVALSDFMEKGLRKILNDVPFIFMEREDVIHAFKTQVTKYLENHELPPKDKYPTVLAQVADEVLLRAKDNNFNVDRAELKDAYFEALSHFLEKTEQRSRGPGMGAAG